MEKNWQYQTDAQSTVTEEGIGNRRLWTAVLGAAEVCEDDAIHKKFLFDSTADFQTVYAPAGVKPDSFRTRLLRIGKIIKLHNTLTPLIPSIAA